MQEERRIDTHELIRHSIDSGVARYCLTERMNLGVSVIFLMSNGNVLKRS